MSYLIHNSGKSNDKKDEKAEKIDVTQNKKLTSTFLVSFVVFIGISFAFYSVINIGDEETISKSVPFVLSSAKLKKSPSKKIKPQTRQDEPVLNKQEPNSVITKTKLVQKARPSVVEKPVFKQVDKYEELGKEVQKAVSLLDKGKIQEAIAMLEEIIRNDPSNVNAIFELSMIYLIDLKNSEMALSYLEKGLTIRPDKKMLLSELINLYIDNDRVEEGISFLQKLQSDHPDSESLNMGIGQLLVAAGNNTDAIIYLERAVSNSKNPVNSFSELSELYDSMGQEEKALETFKRAVSAQQDIINEIDESSNNGDSFAHERLNFMKQELARRYIQNKDYNMASEIIKSLETQMGYDEGVLALKAQLKRLRSSM